MLQSVDLEITAINLLKFPVGEPLWNQPYYLKNVDGLGPTSMRIATSETGASQNAIEIDRIVYDSRTITLTVGIRPKLNFPEYENYHKSRLALESFAPPGTEVRVVVYTTLLERVMIRGVVEEIESDIFSSEPSVTYKIYCPIGYFEARSSHTLRTSDPTPGTWVINYPGTVPTGFTYEITLNSAAVTDFNNQSDYIPMRTSDLGIRAPYLPSGSRITFHTEEDAKGAIFRPDVSSPGSRNYLGLMSRYTHLPRLIPGQNSIYHDYGFSSDRRLIFTSKYSAAI